VEFAQSLISAGVALLLVVGATTDVRSRRIPNVLTIGGALLGALLNAALFGAKGAEDSVLGWLLGCALLLLPFLQRAIGAGDVKLLAAVGAWGGTGLVVRTLLLGALAGGVIALAYLVISGYAGLWLGRKARGLRLQLLLTASLVWPGALRLALEKMDPRPADRVALRATIPYGAALAIGGVAAMLIGGG
jgi:prepilin peptidase CpaA